MAEKIMGVFNKMDGDGSKCIDKLETLKYWYTKKLNIVKFSKNNLIYLLLNHKNPKKKKKEIKFCKSKYRCII